MNVPKPSKVVRRSVAIALAIVCIILVAGIGGVMAYYTMQLNNKDSTYNNYVNDHHQTDEDYNSAIASESAKLIQVNLKAEDNRPFLGQSYLHVYGYVFNVGVNTAYNAVLYVEAWIGAVLMFNTTISLGTINGESYTSVDSQVAYSGNALTYWQAWSNPAGILMGWS